MDHDCGCGHAAPAAHDSAPLEFDADGELILPDPVIRPEVLTRACPIGTLDGSWLLELERRTVFGPEVRGAMRIEVGASSLRVSGDMYSRRVFPPVLTEVERPFPFPLPEPGPQPFGGDADSGEQGPGEDDAPVLSELAAFNLRWYPAFPASQYTWYFRSNGSTYLDGTLTVQIVRHLWNRTTQEFVSTDTGTLTLRCRRPPSRWWRMPGTRGSPWHRPRCGNRDTSARSCSP